MAEDGWLHRRGQAGPMRRAFDYGAAAIPYARTAARVYTNWNVQRTPPRTPRSTPNQRNRAGSSGGPAAGLRNPRFTSTSGKIKKTHKKKKKSKKVSLVHKLRSGIKHPVTLKLIFVSILILMKIIIDGL